MEALAEAETLSVRIRLKSILRIRGTSALPFREAPAEAVNVTVCIQLGSILRGRRGISALEALAEAEATTVPAYGSQSHSTWQAWHFGTSKAPVEADTITVRIQLGSILRGRRRTRDHRGVAGGGRDGNGLYTARVLRCRDHRGRRQLASASGGRNTNGPHTVQGHSAWQAWHFGLPPVVAETVTVLAYGPRPLCLAGVAFRHSKEAPAEAELATVCIQLGSILRGRRGTSAPSGRRPRRQKL